MCACVRVCQDWTGYHMLYWVPDRCEEPGCHAGKVDEQLFWCSKCHMVRYCSPEHQASDWPRHKRECAHLVKVCA